jgi:N-acetylglucosaminyldiphosphoundecaprenol N-acetyl-beta-D-mannosaminyltransferase
MKTNILNYNVDCMSVDDCVEEIVQFIISERGNCRWLACINPHSYAVARQDDAFAKALRAARWLIPDGIGIVIAGRILGRPVQDRITGADIFEGVMTYLNTTGATVFFLGGTEHTLELIRDRLAVDYPGVRLGGTYSPPFKAEYNSAEIDQMIEAVNSSNADVLWVGLTAPKQEKWIYANSDRLNVSFAGAVGAVFDFYTGQVKRSPLVFRSLGLEWLPRLLQQPKRLWRRMFISAPIFLMDVLWERINLLFCLNSSGEE